MSIFKTLFEGIKLTWKYKRIVILLYMMTLLAVLFVAMPLKWQLESTVGHSMMIADIVKGFDYTFLNDYKNAYGTGINPILNQSLIVLFVYLVLFIFLTGGIVSTLIELPSGYDKTIFWAASALHFGRIFRLSVLFLVINGFILAVFLYIFYSSTNGLSPFEVESEKTISNAFKVIAPIYILVAAFFFMCQDYAKVILVKKQNSSVLLSSWQSLRFVLQNFRKSYGLYLLNLLLWSTAIYMNYLISTFIEFNSAKIILLSFLISQLFIFVRFSLKIINISSIALLYKTK